MEEIHLATILIATIIASAYKICNRTPEEAQKAVLNFFKNKQDHEWFLTIGELDKITSW